MKVYTYSQARQQLAKLLEEASLEGEVEIKKRDGQRFILKPIRKKASALDIPGVDTDIQLEEIQQAIREGRNRN